MNETNIHSAIDKIELQHPGGRNGPSILRKEYELLSVFILSLLKSKGEITLTELLEAAHEKLKSKLPGDILWIILNVKNDLEARRLIKITHLKRCVQFISIKRKRAQHIKTFLRSVSVKEVS